MGASTAELTSKNQEYQSKLCKKDDKMKVMEEELSQIMERLESNLQVRITEQCFYNAK